MDNLSTHHRKSVVGLFGEEFAGEIWDRFTIHFELEFALVIGTPEIVGMQSFRQWCAFGARSRPASPADQTVAFSTA